jgi:hypothetical protein
MTFREEDKTDGMNAYQSHWRQDVLRQLRIILYKLRFINLLVRHT